MYVSVFLFYCNTLVLLLFRWFPLIIDALSSALICSRNVFSINLYMTLNSVKPLLPLLKSLIQIQYRRKSIFNMFKDRSIDILQNNVVYEFLKHVVWYMCMSFHTLFFFSNLREQKSSFSKSSLLALQKTPLFEGYSPIRITNVNI